MLAKHENHSWNWCFTCFHLLHYIMNERIVLFIATKFMYNFHNFYKNKFFTLFSKKYFFNFMQKSSNNPCCFFPTAFNEIEEMNELRKAFSFTTLLWFSSLLYHFLISLIFSLMFWNVFSSNATCFSQFSDKTEREKWRDVREFFEMCSSISFSRKINNFYAQLMIKLYWQLFSVLVFKFKIFCNIKFAFQ